MSFKKKKKTALFTFLSFVKVRLNPTTQPPACLPERLVFFFFLFFPTALASLPVFVVPNTSSPKALTYTCSSGRGGSRSVRQEQEMPELLNMCCDEPCQIFNQLLILECFSCFGDGSNGKKKKLRTALHSVTESE